MKQIKNLKIFKIRLRQNESKDSVGNGSFYICIYIYDLEFPFFYLENLIDILSLKLSVSKSILLEIYSVSQKK